MEIIQWVTDHALGVIEAIGIIASLSFTAVSLRKDADSRRISNLLSLTKAHREIWGQIYQRSDLTRILDPKADIERNPVTNEEAVFVTFLIFHLNACFQAMRQKMFITPEALAEDIRWFFSLPVPYTIWKRSKNFQDKEFARFMQACLFQ
jgi:hypothetical protein